jgi:hypothetical protein
MFHSPRLTWQVTFYKYAQFNLHKKGVTPMYMSLLLMSLDKALERECMQEKSSSQSGENASHKGKKGNKQPGTDATISSYQEAL